MAQNWILSPLAIYCTLALAMVGSLILSFSYKFELRQARRTAEASSEALASHVREMELSIGRFQEKVDDISARPTPGNPGMNLGRRVKVLRMHRRGESLETIAAALDTPRNEVELLIRLQELLEGQNG